MEKLSLGDFQTALIVILAVFTALAVIDKGLTAWKNIFAKGGEGMVQRMRAVECRNDVDRRRLDNMERQLARTNEDMEYLLDSMNAILMHEITGNGVDKLKSTKTGLDSYMARRGGANISAKGGD